MSLRVLRSALLLAVSATGCGPASPTPDAGEAAFIALERDFTGYQSWQKFDLGDQPADTVHLAGVRTVYLNRAPPHGATAFPTGTLLVKELTPDVDGGTPQVFAMAKRGGDYNAEGAVGWEWFELAPGVSPPVFLWRGVTPPAGMSYGSVPGGACNMCHTYASQNDWVLGQPLLLGNF